MIDNPGKSSKLFKIKIPQVPLAQNAEPGWLAGEIGGHTGWFPETYVEKVDSTDADYVYEPVETHKLE